MTVDRQLLARFLRENPFQPATGVWRAVEVGFVAERGLPTGRGLDLGCGDGRLFGVLLEALHLEPEVVGIDIDPIEVAAARSTGRYGSVHLAPADRIPEPDSSFDWAFSNSTLEHIESIEATLAETARVLRPGGRFIFTVPSHEFHACLRGPFFGSRDEYLAEVDERCAHLRYWDEHRWGVELERVGMRLVKAERYLTIRETRRWELISAMTAGVLHRVFGKPPIAVQRRLGMRRGQRMPARLAALLAAVLAARLDRAENSTRYACRYFVAERIEGPSEETSRQPSGP
jgi:SAM-dependent methyltransferase